MRRKTEITIKTDRLVIVRWRQSPDKAAWCEGCAAWVRMLTVDESAALSSVSPRVIYRLVESNQLHFKETAAGQLLICPNLPLMPD
jgi:hypothetical protein